MSLTSLARSEIHRLESPTLARRSVDKMMAGAQDFALENQLALDRNGLRDFVTAAAESAAPEKEREEAASNALESLVKYVPTESVTLYVAAASAGDALKATIPFFTPMFSYWFFAALTPLLFLLVYAGKRRAQKLSAFPSIAQWPWWKIVASFIAFLAWGLAVPTNPYAAEDPLKGAAFAFCAIFVSTLLSLIEGVVEPKAAPTEG